ncbi:hypothetical protein HOT45_gp12 [Gordonia phage Trine]|uniref:Uncharacterized protein n=1 Tax=Gordonia phage Trine TaxID=2201431 RepID=A0A2Z4Q926_9CAUD|nr:hypothetical protein HOT45_gp12 [Gordonia phage Trine]AWY06514.1 hypothetical protein PBI_TRINE_12 [Gordonia phage Trine]
MTQLIQIRYLADRGHRRQGELVRMDPVSASVVVGKGMAEYVSDTPSAEPAEPVEPPPPEPVEPAEPVEPPAPEMKAEARKR